MRRAALLGISMQLLSACGEMPPPPPPEPEETAVAAAARKNFWSTLNENRYEQLPAVLAELRAVYADEPRNAVNTRLLGLATLWQLAEHERAPSWNIGDTVAATLACVTYFTQLEEIDPTDRRAPAWLNSVQVPAIIANSGPAMAQEYVERFLAAARSYPEVNTFITAIILTYQPKDDPMFVAGLRDMWTKLSVCSDGRINPHSPDMRAYPEWTEPTERNRHCWQNREEIPHHFEGLWLSFGDILVKNHEPALAKIFYKNAELAGKDYAAWAFRPALEERIRSADERAALYKDADPKNDPLLWNQEKFQCVFCHSR